MTGSMKVHLYDVRRHTSPPIDQTLPTIFTQPLAQRMRTIANADMRLETLAAPNSPNNNSPYWLLDFTNLRFRHGPGKANRAAPVIGFNLGPDDGFGEETAALYDPQHRVILVQYNHHGPRASAICSYINSFDGSTTHDYEFTVRLDAQAANRLNGKSILKKIVVKITPPKISAAMRNGGTSLNRALQISDDLDGNTIELTITSGRSKNGKLNFMRAKSFVQSIVQLTNTTGAVDSLKVTGQASQGTPIEVIDLIEEKMETEITNLTLGTDLRYTQESRWTALVRARNGWNSIL